MVGASERGGAVLTFTHEQVERWAPVVGMSDLSRDVLPHLGDHGATPEQAWAVMHGGLSVVLLGQLARHASVGVLRPRFVEIGAQGGVSTAALVATAAAVDGHVTSLEIDPSCEERIRARLTALGLPLDRWTFRAGPSQEAPVVEGADFLLVDGDHGYPAVCSDMARHGCGVRPGGVIVLDDYHMQFPGKVRWLHERWGALHLVTIGPFAVVTRRAGDESVFRAVFPGGEDARWGWRL